MKFVRINAPDSILSIMAEHVCAVELRDHAVMIYVGNNVFTVTPKSSEDPMSLYSTICKQFDKRWK